MMHRNHHTTIAILQSSSSSHASIVKCAIEDYGLLLYSFSLLPIARGSLERCATHANAQARLVKQRPCLDRKVE